MNMSFRFHMDPSGTFIEYEAKAIGSGSEGAQQSLQEVYHKVSHTVNVLKFQTHFSNKMLVFRAGVHKMLVRISNREDPDQTASSEAV